MYFLQGSIKQEPEDEVKDEVKEEHLDLGEFHLDQSMHSPFSWQCWESSLFYELVQFTVHFFLN